LASHEQLVEQLQQPVEVVVERGGAVARESRSSSVRVGCVVMACCGGRGVRPLSFVPMSIVDSRGIEVWTDNASLRYSSSGQ
jgi:hypothetical protein